MKTKFKSKKTKFKYNKKISLSKIPLTIILIIIFTLFLLIKFNQKMNQNLINISELELKRATSNLINTKITHDILNKDTLNNILIINKNSKGEILYVDFNLDNAYQTLDNITNILMNAIKEMQNGTISLAYFNASLSDKTKGLVLNIPLGSTLNSAYFYNFGPKIPTKINFIENILTNLETKVTNYGFNNALVEVYVDIKLTSDIIAPFKTKTIDLEYKTIISSLMIEGEVPDFYNGVIEKASATYSNNLS